MRSTQSHKRRTPLLAAAVTASLLLAGCAGENGPSEEGMGLDVGFLPSTRDMTDKTDQLISFWNGTWLAALAVGAAVWIMTLVCIVVYRKRKNDDRLPVQTRYHVPLEMMFTVVPVLLVGTLFYFSQSSTATMQDTSAEEDLVIDIYGKQWSWDFVYTTDGVYYSGGRMDLTGEEGVEETLPTLYLPVDQTVEIVVHSRDVNHAIWIPAFLYKVDMIPGRTNSFELTPTREGVYSGKCAELCGEFHSEMLFNVAVVPQEEYDAMMEEYRANGWVGDLPAELGRDYDLPRYPVESASEGN
ncbi:cytochrome c oxidase subunit II [Georgenia sp. Z1344]|uniref:aa3-type cytochrome oxidase subunit II n=1 Tax=Georgenia sp. Z1344 TaxID=3416706 RepID=UPI003CE97937